MIELSGFRVKQESSPDGDIAIEVIGLRPGEKLYEELLIGNDPKATRHPRIMKANEKSFRQWFCVWSNETALVLHWCWLVSNEQVMVLQWFCLGTNEKAQVL